MSIDKKVQEEKSQEADVPLFEQRLRANNELFYRNSVEFQDMEAQYAHFLKANPTSEMPFKKYVTDVYCAENSPHPARFARWYETHRQEAKQRHGQRVE